MKDLHAIWPHRWITSKAESSASRVEGLGAVARENIAAGEKVLVYGGVIVPKSEILKYREHMGHVGIQVSDDFFMCPTDREELERTGVINHSCEPNLGFADPITLIAIRDITKGEELFFDYAFVETFFNPFECNCGSENCRGTIAPNDWQIKEIQSKYKNYFSPYLREKI